MWPIEIWIWYINSTYCNIPSVYDRILREYNMKLILTYIPLFELIMRIVIQELKEYSWDMEFKQTHSIWSYTQSI